MSNVNGKTVRNLALDFTKGVLVLFMVLYHWINYFISTEGYVYRYLRFITPSFIFITGFLITQAYLAKYDVHDPRLPKRLLQRGIKILVMFTLLNLGASLVSPKSHEGSSFGFSSLPAYLVSLYVPEAGRAATFQVLVPIGCLLILCSGLLLMRRWFDYSIYATCAILFAGIFVADVCGWVNGTLELVGIGLLGVYLGNIPTATINRLLPYSPAVLLAYGAYLAAVSKRGNLSPAGRGRLPESVIDLPGGDNLPIRGVRGNTHSHAGPILAAGLYRADCRSAIARETSACGAGARLEVDDFISGGPASDPVCRGNCGMGPDEVKNCGWALSHNVCLTPRHIPERPWQKNLFTISDLSEFGVKDE